MYLCSGMSKEKFNVWENVLIKFLAKTWIWKISSALLFFFFWVENEIKLSYQSHLHYSYLILLLSWYNLCRTVVTQTCAVYH